jgi:hypothetical protein
VRHDKTSKPSVDNDKTTSREPERALMPDQRDQMATPSEVQCVRFASDWYRMHALVLLCLCETRVRGADHRSWEESNKMQLSFDEQRSSYGTLFTSTDTNVRSAQRSLCAEHLQRNMLSVPYMSFQDQLSVQTHGNNDHSFELSQSIARMLYGLERTDRSCVSESNPWRPNQGYMMISATG